MNTANLQLQGLLLAMYALLDSMKQKGVLNRQEIEQALETAEANALADTTRVPVLKMRQYSGYQTGKLYDHRSASGRNKAGARPVSDRVRQNSSINWLRQSKYGYLWITLAFFAISIVGQWLFGWLAYVNEQQDLNAPVEVSDYSYRMLRDTLENWQSEFLQLIWQVAGLAILLYVGSPQSREGDERKEAKLDAILEAVDKDGKKTVATLDRKFHRV